MEPVGNCRRLLGNPWTRVTFRRNLIGFLIIFGLINIILVVLYPQFYGGELFGELKPTLSDDFNDTRIGRIQKLKYKNRIFSFKNEDQLATTSRTAFNPESELDYIKTKVKSTQRIPTKATENSEATGNSLTRKNVYIPASDTSNQNLNSASLVIKQYMDTDDPNRQPSLSKTDNRKSSQPITERSHLKLSTKTISTTATSSEQLNTTGQTQNRQQGSSTSKLEGNAGTSISRQMFASVNLSTDLINAILKKTNSTKPNAPTENPEQLKPTNATTTLKSTTPYQQASIEEPACKPYKLSAKSLEYTAKKYVIQPEVTKCKDQKAPPYELCKVNETKTNDSYTKLEIKCDFSVCDRAKPMSIEFMDHKDGLMKKQIIPKTSNDNEIEKLVSKFAEDARKNDLPFLFVNCTESLTGAVVAQILTFLPSLPVLKDGKTRNKININIFLVDSVSRPHFYRSFPKTINYLKEISNDLNYPANIFNFELFQAVHGHTNENERALFNGSLFPIHLGGKVRNKTPVNLEPLYEVFKKAGFQTMFLDDLCWRGHWGIMDKYKVGTWKSLQGKLKVSNIDTRGISESSCTILNRNNMNVPFYAKANHQICFNARHQHEYVLDYLTKYLDAIPSTPQSKPLFAYTSTHVSHDDVGIRVQTLDTHLKDFIQKMSTEKNTLSIIFADHGNTYTSYQASADGKQEMYHPFMLIVVPKTLGRKFGGRILRNLHENQRRLFNLFDIRAGLVELSRYDGESPLNPTGIFGKLALNRSCDDLLVTEQSKCVCQGWETAVANTTDQLVFAEYAIGQINNKIQASLLESRAKGVQYDKSRVVFGACQRLRVQNIRNVKTRKTRDGTKATTMDVRVQSSNLKDQEELITVQVLSKEKTTGAYEMTLLSHNRISTYGPYRTCMDKDVDVKICVCNNPKDPQLPTAIEEVVGKHSEITKLQRCLHKILRTYNDIRNEPLVKVYEIVNLCRNEEFTVKFEASPENAILSTKTPIVVKLPPQTVQFVATARTLGNIKTAKLNIVWLIEESKSV